MIGRLTGNVEVRKTKSNEPVSVTNIDIALAVGKDEETTYVNNITVWGNDAEFLGNHCKQGSLILVKGRMESGTITDEVSKKSYSITSLSASSVKLLAQPQDRK